MSEHDNLQDADGKNEVVINDTTPNEELTQNVDNKVKTELEGSTSESEIEVSDHTESNTSEAELNTETKINAKIDEAQAEIEASNAEDAEDESNLERQ